MELLKSIGYAILVLAAIAGVIAILYGIVLAPPAVGITVGCVAVFTWLVVIVHVLRRSPRGW